MNSLITRPHPAHSQPEWPPELEAYRDAIEQLQNVGGTFHARGWSLGTSSNYSVVQSRDPVRILITASGKDKAGLLPTDFVVVDPQGRPVTTDQAKSSAETLLHCMLVANQDAGAVLHTHSVWGTVLSDLFADRQGITIEDFEMLKGLEGVTTHQTQAWVPIFDNSQDIPALADEIRRRFASETEHQVHGFLLRQHGLYTWGKDLFAARRHVEIFEFLFECVAQKLMLQANLPRNSTV